MHHKFYRSGYIIWVVIIALLFVGIAISSLPAQIMNQIYVGSRPIGMGGAFSAVANDANAIYWNPAGLPLLQRQELTTMYGNLFGSKLGFTNTYLGYVFPLKEKHALGVDWYHFGFSDTELGYKQNKLSLSYGIRPWRFFSAGLNLKMVDTDMTLDKNSIGKSRGYGLDFGLMFYPLSRVQIAFMGQDLTGTSVSYDNGVSEEIFPRNYRFGAAFLPFEGTTFAVDIDDRLHVGAEYIPFSMMALRAGFQRTIRHVGNYTRKNIYAGGAGFKWKFLRLDYVYEYDPDLPSTHRFSLSFFYNPSLVSVKSARINPNPVFRSLYRNYEKEIFAEVILKNSAQDPLPVSVDLQVPTVLDQPARINLVLPPQSTQSYPLSVAFPNAIISSDRSSYDNLVQPALIVSYAQERTQKQATYSMQPVYVLGRNKINWNVPERVAAFITQDNETIDRFARTVVQQYNTLIRDKFSNSNIGRAMVLFDALGKLGIVYQIDQKLPWFKITQDSTIFDTVQYPTELLASKIGDCDDCMVLFITLMENLGIDTMVLDVSAPGEGHIYMMFDSGIKPENAKNFFLSETEYVIYKDRVWIPVETTMYGFPFMDAWRNGASEYHRRKEQGFIKEIDVAEARAQYTAGVVPQVDVNPPPKEVIDELLTLDVQNFDERVRQMALASGVSLDNPDGLYDAGATYLNLNRLNDAMQMFEKALAMRPNFGDALNAIGVIHTKRREYDKAIDFYRKALSQLPNDAGIRLNVAITYFLMGRGNEAMEEYKNAVKLDHEYEGMLDIFKK